MNMIGMPGAVRPTPAVNRAMFRANWGGIMAVLSPSATSIVRWAFPTSSWFEITVTAFPQPVRPRGLVSMPMNWSMFVRRPETASWMMLGLLLSCTSRCWNSVYHCASNPAPPLPPVSAGLVIAGS
jgi:hypothetical protein